jgi:dienelactone hydrolase
MTIAGFERSSFTHDGSEHVVYRGGEGPGVIVIHEIPGITPEVARFARLVAGAGFTVAMPSMFGTVGRPKTTGYALAQIARACISREFHVLASRGASPLTEWLRALARSLHEELGGRGVGAVGMCITGNFALAMAVDDAMMAPVLSQPSLPFPIGRERRRGLHVSDEALATVAARCAKRDLRVLGLRFTADDTVPAERFARLRAELGDAFEAIEIDSSPGNAHGIGARAHSVLTTDLVLRDGHPTERALQRVLAFLTERLR